MTSMRTMSLVGPESTDQVGIYSSYMATPGSLTGLGGGGWGSKGRRATREKNRFRCGIPCGVGEDELALGQPLHNDPPAEIESSDEDDAKRLTKHDSDSEDNDDDDVYGHDDDDDDDEYDYSNSNKMECDRSSSVEHSSDYNEASSHLSVYPVLSMRLSGSDEKTKRKSTKKLKKDVAITSLADDVVIDIEPNQMMNDLLHAVDSLTEALKENTTSIRRIEANRRKLCKVLSDTDEEVKGRRPRYRRESRGAGGSRSPNTGPGPSGGEAFSRVGTSCGTHAENNDLASSRIRECKAKPKKNKVIVEVRVVFLKIGEIDTLKEQYNADTYIQAKWREPALEGLKYKEAREEIELDTFWNPLLYVDNIIAETKEATWLTTAKNSRGEVYVYERRRVRGVFMENLELNDFPLDVQDLTITITTERPDTEIDIIPDEQEMSAINVQTFVDQQEWRLHEHIEISRKLVTQEYTSSTQSHPALSVTCRAARRPGYFYWNVFLVMFFISALSFATFSVDPSLPQNRLQLSFTLLLTSVAFKFVINQSLPKISYLTYMDKYVLLSLVVLCVVCIWHAVVTIFVSYGKEILLSVERDVFISFVVLYVICHLVFIFWLYFDACKRRRIMNRKDKEYQEFLARKKEWMGRTRDSTNRRHSSGTGEQIL